MPTTPLKTLVALTRICHHYPDLFNIRTIKLRLNHCVPEQNIHIPVHFMKVEKVAESATKAHTRNISMHIILQMYSKF